MTAFSQRIVPTLTEVLDVADLHFAGNGDSPIEVEALEFDVSSPVGSEISEPAMAVPEPVLIDAVLRQSIADAVDAAVADLRARLLPQLEVLIQQALEEQANRPKS